MLSVSIVAHKTGHNIKFVNSLKKLIKANMDDLLLALQDSGDKVIIALFEKHIFIEFLLVNDVTMQSYNYKLRNKNKPTNVLTLQYFDYAELVNYKQNNINLGTILISLDTMLKESEDHNIAIKDHFLRLLIHGLLHLIGYDHNNDEEATIMLKMEDMLLQKLKVEKEALVKNYWYNND